MVHANVKEHLDKYEESWVLTPLKFNWNLTFSPWINVQGEMIKDLVWWS